MSPTLINSYSLSPIIGIGTHTPNESLTVVGNISATGAVYSNTATFASSISAPSLSGTFYGDGSLLTGVVHEQYSPPANATFTSSVSAPALSGVHYGDGSNLTGLPATYTPPANATFTSSVSAPALSGTFYGDGSKLTGITSGSITGGVFTSNLIVSLPGGKTFGRYNSGDTIPANGKTPAEVIQLAISAPIDPTVSLTTSTTVAFNQTNINNVLNFSHIINSLGATLASASLEWRRNNTGSWTQLSTASNTSYTHSITDTNFNTTPFNYRYIIVDSAGATTTATLNITPASYSAPTMSISVVAQSITSPESNSIREKGNVISTVSGSITRNSVNTTLTSYVVQYRVNSGSYVDIGTATSISGSSVTISGFSHTPSGASAADSVSYRISVTDSYTTSNGSASTVTFYYLIFYGSSSSAPLTSSSVRALSNKSFTNTLTNPFILNTGTTETKFTVAMPASTAITLVQDLDASNATLTNNYTNNPFNVKDGGGNDISYNVYTLSIATPYSSSHRHQITRA